MIKLVVVTPGNFAPSGGPEALHQLVSVANEIQYNSAAILYEPTKFIPSSIEPYLKYNCPIIKEKDIPSNAIVVLPEIWPHLSNRFKNRSALWWLSVDFFGTQGHSDLSNIDIHLTQSAYAKQHLKSMGIDSLMLTDWIDGVHDSSLHKEDTIAVNPAKGLDLIESFIADNPNLNTIKIQGMKKNEVIDTLAKSKIYIDFGHHPGRDRMPREACLLDAVVFVKGQGAARFSEDVPIDEWFKFSDILELKDKIPMVLNNYKQFISKQFEYKEWCKLNREEFKKEVKQLLNVV